MKTVLFLFFTSFMLFARISHAQGENGIPGAKAIVEKSCYEIPYGRENHPERIEFAKVDAIGKMPIDFVHLFLSPGNRIKTHVGRKTTEVCSITRVIPFD